MVKQNQIWGGKNVVSIISFAWYEMIQDFPNRAWVMAYTLEILGEIWAQSRIDTMG